ncbi:Tat binding protein 1-interacting protein-domain-containing protein [Thamnocephalis sphaerospora]|uniref:Homologous-pairing protein 2 homolog n=1 Tax=Thamnocephalis sphaerospora TaxID=78915 RepID=A0A4P9XJJ6_9FUNG|nr:Tat binding protein 1-interacting protein-domain-containing protein [Thamnocephalis sphaerospora]|eukprot:RKP05935.1 Tat binding protein 1-interacting protein-domain-containing protein [Thamnocephalis sphaerospora]
MPPKRKRAANDDEGGDETTVLNYLRRTNRPFSAGNNLHNAVTKTAAQKILNQLSERGDVVCKTYGKQQVYVIKQDGGEAPSTEQLQEMDAEIAQLQTQVGALSQETKKLSSVLQGLTTALTTEEVKRTLNELKEENARHEAKLATLRKGGVTIDPQERKRTEAEYEKCRALWKSRKRLFTDIFSAVTEHHPSKPKALMEEIGVETDEDVGVHFDSTAVA